MSFLYLIRLNWASNRPTQWNERLKLAPVLEHNLDILTTQRMAVAAATSGPGECPDIQWVLYI